MRYPQFFTMKCPLPHKLGLDSPGDPDVGGGGALVGDNGRRLVVVVFGEDRGCTVGL